MPRMVSALRRYTRGAIALGSKIGWWKVGAGAAVLLVGYGFISTFGGASSDVLPQTFIRTVELKSVAELSSDIAPLSVVGLVSSRSEATVRAEKSGQVIGVYRALGNSVGVGTIVAEIENDSEHAAVLQAQGIVEAAQANLNKTTGGARSEQIAILESAQEAAKASAVNALLSAYAAIDNAVGGTADAMFSNPNSNAPQFSVTSSDSQLKLKIESTRAGLNAVVAREVAVSGTITASSNLDTELSRTQDETRKIRNFIDDIATQLNKAIVNQAVTATTIATYQANAVAARTALTTALSSISSARQGLETASKNLEQGVAGGQSEDVAGAEAALKQAQGGLAAANANLEKSIIRAPISGTINSFSLKRGDYVQAATPVLTVANNGALEVVAYITEQDARDLAVGARVTFDSGASGVVTRVAPALDPVTKKIELRIGVTDPKQSLINGQSVLAEIVRMSPQVAGVSITIPISAIKVTTDSAYVFTVDSDNTLVSHAVVLGALLGDRVEISDGIISDMKIVTDARGLREGQTVEVK